LGFGIVHEIQINQLLLLQVICLLIVSLAVLLHGLLADQSAWVTYHVLDDIRKQSAAVLPNRMVRDNPLDGIRSFVPVLAVELLTQFPVLTYTSVPILIGGCEAIEASMTR